MIKLIALDLDGTLLMPDHDTVSTENISALTEAAERGIKIVIASGRTYGVFSKGVASLKLLSYAIMSNGASFIKFNYPGDGEPSTLSPVTEMPYELWTSVFDTMMSYGADPEIYALGQSFMDERFSQGYASGMLSFALVEELKSHINFVPDVRETLRGRSIEKICNLTVPDGNRDALMSALSADKRLCVTSAIPGNVEVNLAGTGKGRALRVLADALDISPDEVMAVGDAENDLDMLRFAGCSVAMGNALPQVIDTAKHLTDTNDRHGVAKAIRKYALQG